MWRSIEQLIDRIRRGSQDRGAENACAVRLGIETLENRTVLSANFGGDVEAIAFHEFTAPPSPRVLFPYLASTALAAASEHSSLAFADNREQFPAENGEAHLTVMLIRIETRSPYAGWFLNRGSQGIDWRGDGTAGSVGGFSPEDKSTGSAQSSVKGPLKSQSQTPADNSAGVNGSFQSTFASSFDPPRVPGMTRLLERIAETRRVATSAFPTPIVTTTADDSSTVEAGSLLATYATLAASIDNDGFSAKNHDAAFEAYAPSRDADAATDDYMRLLAEDQTRDAADAGGFVELDAASVVGSDDASNLMAESQREAVESALRSLATRRDAARASTLPENWLEQTWLAEVAEPSDATTDRLAAEPGGMILLQPTTGDDDLIVAANLSEAVETAVEMEAAIGSFQAFDVSIDEASAAIVRPAPAGERDSQQQRGDAMKDTAVDREAASGVGVLTVGAIAIAAKRRLGDRRRNRFSGDAK
jgi:hypothetical protein